MKKLMCMLVACIFVAGGAFAQSDSHTVTVVIDDIQLIDVVGDASITLTTATAGTDLVADNDATSSTLSYSHNQALTQTITVGAAANDVSTNDITLTVNLDGGSDVTLVSGGTVQATTDLEAAIARGAYATEVLDYGASATLSGSVPYSNIYDVTYTIEDD